jgi:exopolysaccharide biosynthesis polyprenyl glycosylphosphotransferase
MISNEWRVIHRLARLYDLLALVAAFALATLILYSSREGISLAGFLALKVTLGNGLLFGILLVAWHNALIISGIYDSKRRTSNSSETQAVGSATFAAASLLFFAAKLFHVKMITTFFVATMWMICTVIMLLGRFLTRSLVVLLRSRGRNRRFLVVVGTNQRAIDFANELLSHPELGYDIVGFVDDEWEGSPIFELSGYFRCCNFSGLAEFLRHNVVDEAAIFLPLRSCYGRALQLVSICEQHGIAIRTDFQIFGPRASYSLRLDDNETSRAITITPAPELWPTFVKRLLDIAMSSVLLALLSPLLLIIAAAIRFTSQGPVFFRQTRVGLNKRHFTMYKFRTMTADAEQIQRQLLSMNEMTGPVFKIKNDPRITSIGGFLRKTSIDELPQLWNVLIGEMSLVGPRAMSLRDYQLFDRDYHRRRFSVKPGITCLWQVCGRNLIPFEQWMELDLQYIDRWSIWLDLKILLQTVPAVFRGIGAA